MCVRVGREGPRRTPSPEPGVSLDPRPPSLFRSHPTPFPTLIPRGPHPSPLSDTLSHWTTRVDPTRPIWETGTEDQEVVCGSYQVCRSRGERRVVPLRCYTPTVPVRVCVCVRVHTSGKRVETEVEKQSLSCHLRSPSTRVEVDTQYGR